MKLALGQHPSPVGVLTLAWDEEEFLRALDFDGHEERFRQLLAAQYGRCELNCAPVPSTFQTALGAYFRGDLTVIDSIPVRTAGTPFQEQVWAALRQIPAGTTLSYGQIAARLGRVRASRAVGRANGSNPVGIVVPCHRVIGADGSLTGYGGGMERKRWLLQHERAHVRESNDASPVQRSLSSIFI
jgi:methylated-DNA-[protein]-cysteine S-methyltransferase